MKRGGRGIQDESSAWLTQHGVPGKAFGAGGGGGSSTSVAKELRQGSVAVTSGGRLACAHILHTVGPIWDIDPQATADFEQRKAALCRQLKTAVVACLAKAETLRLASVSIPAISTGKFGFPLELCAALTVEAVYEWSESRPVLSSLRTVSLANWDGPCQAEFHASDDGAGGTSGNFISVRTSSSVKPAA